ncbi:ATP-grasp domain-containing protein [Sinomicrobium weinanense]|uniref:ATP-grasp domain-containing protein n=1 Tax=Sinomicrobium weinanense TaxID=2842200 RepID=A0A926JWJ0_9FLAO|nr:ATP-grasp domain-containing protein [Sinomicrobium weinanense]MBC9798483.1 ATP-grasp domain-containing protein [Sinomicrobium weinanense]MBU3123716.1 ATP-grasp domain-containing protein [Sinomicrobium weinanense]
MKKLLLFGGLRYLIPVIKAAKNMGHYVITCDYLPDNIAHIYSDEYHNVSITDKENMLKLAQSLQVDGVMSFAVDPGVTTAAYVSDKMGLSCAGPYQSVQILQNKALFRNFLEMHNFNVPKSHSYSNVELALRDFDVNDLPVIVKPVDAAGSKGVTKVTRQQDLEAAITYAIGFSSTKTFIIEEFIESKGFSSDTDCFSIDGELSFVSFSSQRFDPNSPNPYTPSAYSWPSNISKENQEYLKTELQRLISLLDMRSSIYNIEVREGINNKAYIMEVSPRGGGNRLSEMLHYATGVDLITCSIQAALGEKIDKLSQPNYNGNWGEIILYSNKSGTFKELKIADEIVKNVVEVDLWVEKRDAVKAFTAANEAIGTLVLKFESQDSLEAILSDYSQYIEVVVE